MERQKMAKKASKKKAVNQPKIKPWKLDWQKVVLNVSGKFEIFLLLVGNLNQRLRLHGINHILNKRYHPLERILWLFLVIASFFGVALVVNKQMARYKANPTVISLERGNSNFFNPLYKKNEF
jgi:hypothetical protein